MSAAATKRVHDALRALSEAEHKVNHASFQLTDVIGIRGYEECNRVLATVSTARQNLAAELLRVSGNPDFVLEKEAEQLALALTLLGDS